MINGDRITPVDGTLITTGEFRPVKGTPMDFTTRRKSGWASRRTTTRSSMLRGYDINYVINKKGSELSLAARVRETQIRPRTGSLFDGAGSAVLFGQLPGRKEASRCREGGAGYTKCTPHSAWSAALFLIP